MTARREKSKPQKPQINKQLEAATEESKPKVNQRKDILYVIGLFIVVITLWIGLILTNKRKDN